MGHERGLDMRTTTLSHQLTPTTLLLLIIGFNSCCGTDELTHIIKPNNITFDPYRTYFEQQTGHTHTSYVPIYYGNAGEGNIIASCKFRTDHHGHWINKRIVVNANRFDNLSRIWKRAIVAHELIHCHLEVKEHTEPVKDRFGVMDAELATDIPLTNTELEQALVPFHR